MSDRLRELVKDYIEKAGHNGVAKLSVASELGTTTIQKVLRGHVPLPKHARDIALACGVSLDEAHELEAECSSLRAKEAAS